MIEGTTSSLYGGAVADRQQRHACNIVQIRYSGFAIAPGNELQGLTLGGVGSNTTIDHIQVHNSSDDGIEIFGGRPNLKHLVVTGADDDSLDTDLGYRGTIQFVIGVQRDAGNGDSMIEADSNGNEDALPRQYTRVSNATFVQRSTAQGGNTMLLRGGTDYALLNSVVVGTAGLPRHRRDRRHHHPRRRRRAAGSRPAGLPLGPARLPDRFPQRRQRHRGDDRRDLRHRAPTTTIGAYVPTLTSVFINGANETAVTATDPTPFNADTLRRRPPTRRRRTGSPRSPISARSRTRPTPGTPAGPATRATSSFGGDQRRLHRRPDI